MNAEEIMIEADKLLQKWELYSLNNRSYIEDIFNGKNRYDMMLNVDVFQKQAKIYMLERGAKIYEYRTENQQVIMYAVIRDVVVGISNKFIPNSKTDKKGHLRFVENSTEYRKQIVDEAFSVIGEPYNEWNKMGITIWNFDKHFKEFPYNSL